METAKFKIYGNTVHLIKPLETIPIITLDKKFADISLNEYMIVKALTDYCERFNVSADDII